MQTAVRKVTWEVFFKFAQQMASSNGFAPADFALVDYEKPSAFWTRNSASIIACSFLCYLVLRPVAGCSKPG